MTAGETPLHLWGDRLEASIAELDSPIVSRVAVVAETASTQDAARRMAGRVPGLVVLAGQQTAGRGRLGREWRDRPGRSLAMTLALDAHGYDGPSVALGAGVAVAAACSENAPGCDLGLKWPNDVVDRATACKIGGILIEMAGPLLLVGIGINVSHTTSELREAGLSEAASLAELTGVAVDRIGLAEGILKAASAIVLQPEGETIERWRALETLTGTHQTFEHNGSVVSGLVESIDPALTLVVRTEKGLVPLPAMTTSVVNGDDSRHAV